MSSNLNPENVQVVLDPSAFAGNLYLIQMENNSSETIHQYKPENDPLANISIEKNQIYIKPEPHNDDGMLLNAPNTNLNTNIINQPNYPNATVRNVAPSTSYSEKKKKYLQPKHKKGENSVPGGHDIIKILKNEIISPPHRPSITAPLLITNYVHVPDRAVPPRAVATLPPCLRLRRDTGAIYSPRRLAARARFGPLRGINSTLNHAQAEKLVAAASAAHKPIFLMKRDPHAVIHVDVTDKDKSNWLSLLPLGDDSSANVMLYEESNELYVITTKEVSPRTPLTIGYSRSYFERHKLTTGMPVLELKEVETPAAEANCWRCIECDMELGSETLLQKHLYKHRMCTKSAMPKRAKCRCSHCKRIFSNKFSLRRHIKQDKCVMASQTNKDSLLQSNKSTRRMSKVARNRTEQCPTPIEENRNSDESLQNYTNGLDISTNLFDPDRMPNLDTSGDFNPFSLLSSGAKEDSLVNNDAEYAKFTNDLKNKCNKNKPKAEEKVLCPYCKQNVLKSKHRQHFRNCKPRKLKCECGHTFYKKESLSAHIQARHPVTLAVEPEINVVKTEKPLEDNQNKTGETPYECDECKVTFKRRGMLVNHMWRLHQRKTSARMQRTVRLYPCAACPKVYSTNAKRKQHTLTIHPGTGLEGAGTIDIACAASSPVAACPACPRQYSTRAKLNQHMREKHPLDPLLLAPPKILHGATKRENSTENQQQSVSDPPTSQSDYGIQP